ncbi:hypothetical protein ABT086_01605 [Streptomyces mirabilis]
MWRTEQVRGAVPAEGGDRHVPVSVHQGPWSAYGVAQRKEKEAKAKKRRIRKKR